MNRRKALVMLCLAVLAAMEARGRTIAKECATVQLENSHLVDASVLQSAENTATRIFGDIGVSVRWMHSAARPVGEACLQIHVGLSSNSPADVAPGALAYSLPYQNGGTQIQVFLDRALRPLSAGNGIVLGHVMAHEIGHVIEGVSRHSDKGVMKAYWTDADFYQMSRRQFQFAHEDEGLIHKGLSNRQTLLYANR